MERKFIQAIAVLLLFIVGCRPRYSPEPLPPNNITGRQVYVVCEGSLGNGNGALSLYLPEKDSVYNDVYKSANSTGVGDVFESMTRIGNRYFLCINNSDKVLCIRADNRQLVGSITIPKPRNILYLSPTKAYVSTLFSNKVYIINPQTLQITGNITLPYMNPEGMALANGRAYICTWDTAAHAVTTIDTATNTIATPLTGIGASPTDVLTDADGMLWILAGNKTDGVPARLTRISPATGAVLASYPFNAATDPLRPCFNNARDTLYWIEADYNGSTANNGIYRMDIHAGQLPTQAFIPAQSLQYFWAVGIEPATGYIYVGNPLGFTQQGTVSVYTQRGALVKTFKVGVGPGHFYFEQ